MTNNALRQYALVTGNYWAFTLTDGALRLLVVLYFHQLGYSPLAVASLFLFYEFFGIVTNLVGGYLGARIGLNRTMQLGLGLQIIALVMLTLPQAMLTIPWVMAAQALSGIAKDLNKMSAKSAIKSLVPAEQDNRLFKWVALLTGSKNALKGVGFFLGGALLALWGFQTSIWVMAVCLALVWVLSLLLLRQEFGKAKTKPKFTQIFSTSKSVNVLSAARLFLFGARDIWFVVALPVFMSTHLGWSFWWVGGYMAAWVIGYGIVQSAAPLLLKKLGQAVPNGRTAVISALLLTSITALLALQPFNTLHNSAIILSVGLCIFGVAFAINSSIHSYLIVHYAKAEAASLDVGFYYMANAGGRLIGTLLSGWVYQSAGLNACLWYAVGFLVITSLLSKKLPR